MIKLQKGLTLIELMVSMLLGLFIISTVSATFLRTSQTTQLNHQLSLMQSSAHAAMKYMAKDVRIAGYTGCDLSVVMGNAIAANSAAHTWATSEQPVQGLNRAETINRIDALAQSESLLIFKLDTDVSFNIINHQTSSSTIILDSNVSSVFSAGDAAGISRQDCSQTALVSLASVSGTRVIHNTASVGNFRNCFTDLKGSFRCYDGSSPTGAENFNPGLLKPLRSTAYFIRTDNGIPGLFRKDAGNTNATLLVDGIEDMRIYYGLDKNANGVADRFIRPIDLSFQHSDWHNIRSIRLHLLSRSEVELTPTARDYFFDGAVLSATDRFLRREYVMTIALRNLR